jgi:hypothetical protein
MTTIIECSLPDSFVNPSVNSTVKQDVNQFVKPLVLPSPYVVLHISKMILEGISPYEDDDSKIYWLKTNIDQKYFRFLEVVLKHGIPKYIKKEGCLLKDILQKISFRKRISGSYNLSDIIYS